MKKISIVCVGILLLVLCFNELKLDREFKSSRYSEGVSQIEVSLKSTKEKLVPKYYKDGFDFKYDILPSVQIIDDEDTLIFSLLDNEEEQLIIGEDYYKYYSDMGVCEKETYILSPTDDGNFELQVKRRGNVRDETAIYYIKCDEGIFVMRANFLLAKSE